MLSSAATQRIQVANVSPTRRSHYFIRRQIDRVQDVTKQLVGDGGEEAIVTVHYPLETGTGAVFAHYAS